MPLLRYVVFLSLLLCSSTSQPEKRKLFDNILSKSDDTSAVRVHNEKWRESLNDPVIHLLINKPFSTNQSLGQVLAQIGEAKSRLGILRSGHILTMSTGVSQSYGDIVDTGERSRTILIDPNLRREIDLFKPVHHSNNTAESRQEAHFSDAQHEHITWFFDDAKTALDFRTFRSFSFVLKIARTAAWIALHRVLGEPIN